MSDFKLPPHIILDKEGYYYSKKTDRYISQKNISAICEKYWENEEKEVVTKTVTLQQIINKSNKQKKMKTKPIFIEPALSEVEKVPVKTAAKYPSTMFEPTNWEKR